MTTRRRAGGGGARRVPRRRCPADGRRRRRLPPGARPTTKIKKTGRDGPGLELEPTTDVLAALVRAAPPRPDAGRASRPSTATAAVERGRGEARAQAARRRGGERHLARGHRLRHRAERGDDRHCCGRPCRCRAAPRSSVAAAVLDAVEALRARSGMPSTVERRTDERRSVRVRPLQARQRAARGGRLIVVCV